MITENNKTPGGNARAVIKIYQINLDRDKFGVAFGSYERYVRIHKSSEVISDIYDMVFDGAMEASDIEDIYYIFNTEKPEGYKGRSMSVSDVVEVIESDDIRPGFYYCDSIGFKMIEFTSSAKNGGEENA